MNLVHYAKIAALSAMVFSLAASAGVAQSQVKTHKVAEVGNPGSVSRDGRYISYVDIVDGDDQVFVQDLNTGESRCLTEGPGEAGWAVSSVISPDGKQVAYDWALGEQREWTELRLIDVDGSSPRVLYRSNDLLYASVEAWTADGNGLLATLLQKDLTYEIAQISVSDGSVRVITTKALSMVNGRLWRNTARYSPDERFIAYDFPPQRDATRDIFVVPAAGGSEIPLVKDAANNRLLDWTSNGRILFASDRTDKWAAWVVPVADGKASGPAVPADATLANVREGLGFTRDGSYFYGVSSWVNDVYVAEFDPSTGRLDSPKKVVDHVGPDTSVAWSPDGQILAFALGYGHEPDLFVLGFRSVETGKERLLPASRLVRFGSHPFGLHWSSDGRSLLGQGRDKDFVGPGMDSMGIYQVDVQTGAVTPIVQVKNLFPADGVQWPTWLPNGTVVYVRWGPGFRSIVSQELGGGRETELYREASPTRLSRLAASPNGQRIAFVSTGAGKKRLNVISAFGGDAHELLTLPGSAGAVPLAWTHDSRYIVYAASTCAEKPGFEMWRIPADGGEPLRLGLSMDGLLPYGLSVHPDGRRIAFTAGTPKRSQVWVAENLLPNSQVPHSRAN